MIRNNPLKIFLIAGEQSGDALAAPLMRALKKQHGNVMFCGVGGELMTREGLMSIFPMEELSVMGVAEVLPKIFNILSRIHQTAEDVKKIKPDIVVTIDSPDFCFRVIKKIKKSTRDIPCVHYVAPSVWVWRAGRALKISKFLDHLLTLLPFEPPYFEKHGLNTTFVGHSIVEKGESLGDGMRFRQKYNIEEGKDIFCILPGSRMSELSRLLPVFKKTIGAFAKKLNKEFIVVIPTLPHLKSYIDNIFAEEHIKPIVVTAVDDKFDCFASSRVALAASGTVSLELAMTGTPHIIAYKLNILTAMVAKVLIKAPFANLINVILGKEYVPELLLEKCNPETISAHLIPLMNDEAARQKQINSFHQALKQLGLGADYAPSEKAAMAVLSVVDSCNNSK